MINNKYKIILMFTIVALFINTTFMSAMSSDLETNKNLIDIKNNNYPLESNALLAYWSLNEGNGIYCP